MDDQLRRLLTELNTAIQRSQEDGQIDDREKTELRSLVKQVESVLDAPEGEHDGLVDQLESATIRFESDHPTIAAVIRSAVDTLTGYGI